MANEKQKVRREFLEKIGGFTHMSVIQETARVAFDRVEKVENWEKVPNFFTAIPERSDLVKQLTLCIIQLQAEVDRLRRGR